MSRLKDKEKFYLIAKVFCDINGPSTAAEVLDYIVNSDIIKLHTIFTRQQVGRMLGNHPQFQSDKSTRPYIYTVKPR